MFTGNCLLSTAMNISLNTLLDTECCNPCKSSCYSNNDGLGLAPFNYARSSQGGLDLRIKALELESIFGEDLGFILLSVSVLYKVPGVQLNATFSQLISNLL